MLGMIIEGALQNMPDEMKKSLKKIDEFLPIVNTFLDSIPLDASKGELGVSFMLRFENNAIVLYQVVLASLASVNNGKPFVSRQLEKWNVTEKINEITKGL